MEDVPASGQKPQSTVEDAEPMQEDGENGGSGAGEAQDEEPVEDLPKVRIVRLYGLERVGGRIGGWTRFLLTHNHT